MRRDERDGHGREGRKASGRGEELKTGGDELRGMVVVGDATCRALRSCFDDDRRTNIDARSPGENVCRVCKLKPANTTDHPTGPVLPGTKACIGDTLVGTRLTERPWNGRLEDVMLQGSLGVVPREANHPPCAI